MADDLPPSTAARNLIGIGLYTPGEAERLTRVPAASIWRWLFGYHRRQGDCVRQKEPVWYGQIAPLDGAYALGFLDLIEIRFVDASASTA